MRQSKYMYDSLKGLRSDLRQRANVLRLDAQVLL